MTDGASWRVAVHESGHCTASYLLGATAGAGPVTIVPRPGFGGICFGGHVRRYPEADLDRLALPYPLLPARLRRHCEVSVMFLLAGSISEDLYAGAEVPAFGARVPNTAPLPPREAAALEKAAAADSHQSDVAKAFKLLRALHFDSEDLAHRHAAFLAAETEAVIGGEKGKRLVLALAGELMTYRTLPARRWQAILEAAL